MRTLSAAPARRLREILHADAVHRGGGALAGTVLRLLHEADRPVPAAEIVTRYGPAGAAAVRHLLRRKEVAFLRSGFVSQGDLVRQAWALHKFDMRELLGAAYADSLPASPPAWFVDTV